MVGASVVEDMGRVGGGGGVAIAEVPQIAVAAASVVESDCIRGASNRWSHKFGYRIIGVDGETKYGVVAVVATLIVFGPYIRGGGETVGAATAGADALIEC
jgi:hypothetical protein